MSLYRATSFLLFWVSCRKVRQPASSLPCIPLASPVIPCLPVTGRSLWCLLRAALITGFFSPINSDPVLVYCLVIPLVHFLYSSYSISINSLHICFASCLHTPYYVISTSNPTHPYLSPSAHLLPMHADSLAARCQHGEIYPERAAYESCHCYAIVQPLRLPCIEVNKIMCIVSRRSKPSLRYCLVLNHVVPCSS